MPFVRVKKISGKEYAYLVENKWLPWGSRQKVLGYLGKVFRPERAAEGVPQLAKDLDYPQSILALVGWELRNHGFEENGTQLVHPSHHHTIDLQQAACTDHRGKPLAIAMNEGFFCAVTLRQLLEFKQSDSREATMKTLASTILEAGLKISPETFAELYEKVSENRIVVPKD